MFPTRFVSSLDKIQNRSPYFYFSIRYDFYISVIRSLSIPTGERNLVFQVGGDLDRVFQTLIDRSRAPLDLRSIRTILGYRRRLRYRRTKRSAECEVTVERPAYDLTIFKLHCGKLTLKIYSKGERVLRIEAAAHNTRELNCGRALDTFPEIVSRLKAVLERFADNLSCIDQCFIGDDMLEQLRAASQVGKTIVGGIDLNKTRMRTVVEAVIALSPPPNSLTASEIAQPGCASAVHHTVPATPLTISKSFAANRSFAASATLAATNRSPAGFARSPRSSSSATRLSNRSSPPPGPSTLPAVSSTPNPSMPTTTPCGLRCTASSTNSASPLEDRQSFRRASPRSA
jgi:hypothetical protein